MKLIFFTCLFCLASAGFLKGQSSSSTVYKDLATKKFFAVSMMTRVIEGERIYIVENKKVDKLTYDSFQLARRNMENCRPCILKVYNGSNQLLREGVYYTDAPVGWEKIYYPNGKIKISGQYKENSTNDWGNLCTRHYCGVKIGRWTYFDEGGKQLYAEDWKGGEFITQIPEQLTPEIWKMEFAFQGKDAENLPLRVEQISEIDIIPRYKNKAHAVLTVKLYIEAVGYRSFVSKYGVDEFKGIDTRKLLLASGIPMDKNPRFILEVLKGENNIGRLYLTIAK